MGVGPALVLAAAVLVAVVVAVLSRRRDEASPSVLDSLSRTLGQLQGELARLGRHQEDLRQDVQRGRLDREVRARREQRGHARKGIFIAHAPGDVVEVHEAEVVAIQEG